MSTISSVPWLKPLAPSGGSPFLKTLPFTLLGLFGRLDRFVLLGAPLPAVEKKFHQLFGPVIREMNSVPLLQRAEVVAALKKTLQLTDRLAIAPQGPRVQTLVAHHEDVVALCGKVALALNLPSGEIGILIRAAGLHDIGKLGVSALNTISKLNGDKESKRLKSYHLYFGFWLLAGIDYLQKEAAVLMFCHFFDGYPEGLKRRDMTISSQILSAADYYCALKTERAYKPANNGDEAYFELIARGYDQKILEALLRTC